MEPDHNPMSYPPVPIDRKERLQQLRRRQIILIVSVLSAVFLILSIVVIPSVYVLVYKRRETSPSPPFNPNVTSTLTTRFPEKPRCLNRPFGSGRADILYSFDCQNGADDVSGTYNAVPAAQLKPEFDNETVQSLSPKYVTPDHAGQGAALKLNSSIPYQHLTVERFPNFANRTFSISVWLKPALAGQSMTAVLAQSYKDMGDNFFAAAVIDRRPLLRVYKTVLHTSVHLKNSQWQYVTYTFGQSDLSMAIRIDGLVKAHGFIVTPELGPFEIEQTTIGSAGELNQYNGLIDQLSIAFRPKSRDDTLDEATLVVLYNFEDGTVNNDSLLNDASTNRIRARGANLTGVVGGRRTGQVSLLLTDSSLSYFQSSGFVLLYTHNYTYSYALWISIVNASSNLPWLQITRNDEIVTSHSTSTCLALFIVDKVDPVNNTMQLSMYSYGPHGHNLIPFNVRMQQSTWYHLVVVSTRNDVKLYLNATLISSFNASNTFQIDSEHRLSLTIGNPLNGSMNDQSDVFTCHVDQKRNSTRGTSIAVDEVRFYARELKPREIQALTNDDFSPTRYFFEENADSV